MTEHTSDCAIHNAPAMEPGPCDCGAINRNKEKFGRFAEEEGRARKLAAAKHRADVERDPRNAEIYERYMYSLLFNAAHNYRAEMQSPVPDYSQRRLLRQSLFDALDRVTIMERKQNER